MFGAARRGALRWPVTIIAASAKVTMRQRRPCLVTPVGNGLLAHRYAGGSFVFPTLTGQTAAFYRRQAYDTFFWHYVPQPGDLVVDVGAGIGEETLTISRLVGPTGRVISIEAQPDTYERLVICKRLNRLANVETYQLAVTDRRGVVRMALGNSGTHVGLAITDGPGVEVPADTLDAILDRSGVTEVAYLKMNIEGAERLAIRGMTATLQRTRHVAVSCHDFLVEQGGDPAEVATFEGVSGFLASQGFSLASRPDDPLPWNRYYLYGTRPISI